MAGAYMAFCWSSGLIQFGNCVPEGAIEICRGARTTVVREVTVAARHGRGGVLLVPGVPEAQTQKLKGDALGVWLAWCGGGRSNRFITWSHMDAFGKFRDPKEVDRVAKALLAQMNGTRP
jgi:hypothetical protein